MHSRMNWRNLSTSSSRQVTTAQIAALKPKELQPAELLSTACYKSGEMIEYQPDGQKPVCMGELSAW